MVICPSLERTDDILQINDLCLWSDLYLQNCINKLYKECTVEHYRTALKRFASGIAIGLKRVFSQNERLGISHSGLVTSNDDSTTIQINQQKIQTCRQQQFDAQLVQYAPFSPGCMMKVICHGISQVGFRFHQFVKSRRRQLVHQHQRHCFMGLCLAIWQYATAQ